MNHADLNSTEFALLALIDEHTGDNGGDFTFSDEISWDSIEGIKNEQSYGAYLASLMSKGYVAGDYLEDYPKVMQIDLSNSAVTLLEANNIAPNSYIR